MLDNTHEEPEPKSVPLAPPVDGGTVVARSTKHSRKKSKADAPVVTAAASSELRGVVQRIRRLKDIGTRRFALEWHAVGVEVLKVAADPAKYGLASKRKAVVYLADQTKLSVDSIYNALKVAVAWPNRQDFARLLKREGKDGARLTFVHFVEVEKLDTAVERAAMLERVLAEDLSSRDVRRERKGRPEACESQEEAQPAAEPDPRIDQTASVSAPPSDTVGPVHRLISAGRQALEGFGRMVEEIEALDADTWELAEASEVLEQLGNLCLGLSAGLELKGANAELAAIEELDEQQLEEEGLTHLHTAEAEEAAGDIAAAALGDQPDLVPVGQFFRGASENKAGDAPENTAAVTEPDDVPPSDGSASNEDPQEEEPDEDELHDAAELADLVDEMNGRHRGPWEDDEGGPSPLSDGNFPESLLDL